jgi:hypothetical protein
MRSVDPGEAPRRRAPTRPLGQRPRLVVALILTAVAATIYGLLHPLSLAVLLAPLGYRGGMKVGENAARNPAIARWAPLSRRAGLVIAVFGGFGMILFSVTNDPLMSAKATFMFGIYRIGWAVGVRDVQEGRVQIV